MASFKNQVSAAVRILLRNRDVSARATHLKAADGIVPSATLERKLMSTKTVFKRVALVAAAALAIGGVSAVSANAAAVIADSFTTSGGASTASSTGTAGTAVTLATVASGIAAAGSDTIVVGGSVQSSPLTSSATSITWADTTGATQVNSTFSTVTVSSVASGRATRYLTASFTPDVAGTYVIKLTSTATNSQSITWTITAAGATNTIYNHSTAYISTTTSADLAADGTNLFSSAAGTVTVAAALITVSQYGSVDTATRLTDAASTAVTVSISGAGAVGTSASARASSVTVAAGATSSSLAGSPSSGVQSVYLYPDGRIGVATVTITVNGAVVATKSFTFGGTFAAYKTTSTQKAPLGVGGTEAMVYTGVDAAGNAVAITGTTAATSSNTQVATVSVSGSTVTVTGVGSGTATISVTNGATTPVTTSFTVTVTKATAKTVTMAFDKASYSPGEKMILTVSAVDSNGSPVGDGSKNLFSGANVTSSVSLGGTLPSASVTLAGGSATYTLYAPLAAGPVLVSGVEGSDTDNVIAGGTAATISASATVAADTTALDAANAAADAAAEATDAANAATDAANAAADAADSATSAAQDAADQAGQALAAVNSLATSVAALIAGIKAQLTSLTNLVVKLQKSVSTLPKK